MEAMCAVLHQYRRVDANKGGAAKVDISLEMGPTGDLWVTRSPRKGAKEKPHKL